MKISWKPAGDEWSGSLQVDLPGYEERLRLAGKLRQPKAVGHEVEAESDELSQDNLQTAALVFQVLKERVSDVALVHVPTGTEFKDLDSLGCYEEGCNIIKDLQTFVFGGMKLGNGSKQQ